MGGVPTAAAGRQQRLDDGSDVDDLVIETSGLRKDYRRGWRRKVSAVHDLDLAVPAGSVHGLLGPNGSGKTTTIRMLLGLARPTSGEIRLFGEPVPRRLPRVISRVGAVVDQPRFAARFNGRRNLTLLADSAGVPHQHIDRAVARVGLGSHDREAFRTYSPVMRQRLAIAAALMRRPDLLILDEPTHGLDPAGVRDIRRLVRDLARNGLTVLLSSHILAEVQQVCDSVSIIGNGGLLASGAVDELVGREPPSGVRLGLSDRDAALAALREAGFDVVPDGRHLYVASVDHPEELTRLLAGRDLWVREMVPDGGDLEQVMVELAEQRSESSRGRGEPA